jgi:Plasmid pRiA4b ORF-3-like protein
MRRRPIRRCRAWRSKTSGRALEAAGEWPLAVLLVVARTWLSIWVDLVSGLGGDYWPRPGRIFAAARSHSFRELAGAIDTAFARWDRSHLYQFVLDDGRRIGQPEFDDFDQGFIDGDLTRLGALTLGEQFLYEFDFGDSWLHLCTVGSARIDPTEQLGIVPTEPLPYWGWGTIPDQYGRRWDGDDGGHDTPPDPGTSDLPPLHPWWGQPPRR